VGVVLNCKQKCRLRVKNWLVGCWHQYLSLWLYTYAGVRPGLPTVPWAWGGRSV